MDEAALGRIKSGASSVADEFKKVDNATGEVTKEIQRQESIAISVMKKEAAAMNRLAGLRSKELKDLKEKSDWLDRAATPMFSVGVAGITAITLLAKKYVDVTKEQEKGLIDIVASRRAEYDEVMKNKDATDLEKTSAKNLLNTAIENLTAFNSQNEAAQKFEETSGRIEAAQTRIGKIAAEAVLPLYEKLADIAEKGAAFVEQNPGAIEAGLKASIVLAGLGGLGILAVKGMRLYADWQMIAVGNTQLLAAKIMADAAKKQLIAAGGGTVANGAKGATEAAGAKGAAEAAKAAEATAAEEAAAATAAEEATAATATEAATATTVAEEAAAATAAEATAAASTAEATTAAVVTETATVVAEGAVGALVASVLGVVTAVLGGVAVGTLIYDQIAKALGLTRANVEATGGAFLAGDMFGKVAQQFGMSAEEAGRKTLVLTGIVGLLTGAYDKNSVQFQNALALANQGTSVTEKNTSAIQQQSEANMQAAGSANNAAAAANNAAGANNSVASSFGGLGASISSFIQQIISSFTGGGQPVHDYTGYAYKHTYAMAQDGKRQFVMSGSMTRVAEQMLGGQLNQQMVMSALAGGGRNSVVWQDQRRFSGEYTKSMRNAQRADTLEVLGEVGRKIGRGKK